MPPEPEPDAQAGDELDRLGFAFDGPDDAWIGALRRAEQPCRLGSIGDYELIEEVCRGGQGVVFRARQPGTKRMIALKRMLAGSLASNAMRRRFQREVEAACALNHPNIVTAYGMEEIDGCPVFAMEWVEGQPTTTWARGPGRNVRDPREVLEVFLRICDAVAHAHSRGVLHRDLKPSNILVDETGQPHVLDFGLAKLADPVGEESHGLTVSSDFIGTPAYASPEQLAGGGSQLDFRTDIYSLGVILFEMLTGESPYPRSGSVTEWIRAVENLDPPRPSSLDPRLGHEVDRLVRKAMANSRDERYGSVDALAADLRRYLAGEPIQAVEPSSWYLLKKLCLRNRLATAFAATVLVLLTAFGAHANWQVRRYAAQAQDLSSEVKGARQARAEMFDKYELATDAADRMRLMMLQFADVIGGAPAGLTVPAGITVTVERSPGRCSPEILGTPNPYFEELEFQAPPAPGLPLSEAPIP